jgi:ParB/RepB/Spo0J family partition protein
MVTTLTAKSFDKINMTISKEMSPLEAPLNTACEILPKVKLLALDSIKASFENTFISQRKIFDMCESIKEVGLLQPVTVSDTNQLLAGRHRYLAYQKLGRTHIPVIVVSLDQIRQQIAEIDENLIRRSLSVLELSLNLKKKKELYEILYPQTRRGGSRKNHNDKTDTLKKPESFAVKFSSEQGISSRSTHRLLHIAANLTDKACELIKYHRVADNRTELAHLAAFKPDVQISIAEKLAKSNLSSVKTALKKLADESKNTSVLQNPETLPKKSGENLGPGFNLVIKSLETFFRETRRFRETDWDLLIEKVKICPKSDGDSIVQFIDLYKAQLNSSLQNSQKKHRKASNRLIQTKSSTGSEYNLPLFDFVADKTF